MIVCMCKGVSDRDVRAAIEGGATCVGRLEDCGIGGDCGGCDSLLREMLAGSITARRANPCGSCCKEGSAVAS